VSIDTILKRFEHFGVRPGLERSQQLLAKLGNPHSSVPVIHVAGTNGKGSVCAYLSAVLAEAGYRTGRYISPHLVDWTERICLNEEPISPAQLQQILRQIEDAIQPDEPSPTQFEVITAAAWLYFAQQQVDVAVMEVGLGGRLDATNVCDRPLVSLITSISWEHWQVLGPTLADIAGEKAGILKPGCPAVVGQLPPEARAVVEKRIAELGCPAVWPEPAAVLESASLSGEHPRWASYQGIEYPLPLEGDIQLGNSALAIAGLQILRRQGWKISDETIAAGMAKTRWPGRLQWVTWRNRRLLVDGAHNQASAQVLRQYVDSLDAGAVTWVMGILASKDRTGMFKALLRPQDRLLLVPVPDPNSAAPEELAAVARTICPELADCRCFADLEAGLEVAAEMLDNLTVLCGSLYLIGHFLKLR
jgi:dihydrofolate synthase/folylpolyglutamate synthase